MKSPVGLAGDQQKKSQLRNTTNHTLPIILADISLGVFHPAQYLQKKGGLRNHMVKIGFALEACYLKSLLLLFQFCLTALIMANRASSNILPIANPQSPSTRPNFSQL